MRRKTTNREKCKQKNSSTENLSVALFRTDKLKKIFMLELLEEIDFEINR